MRTLDLGEAVGPGVPTGGTANQVLVKNGATNFDTSWKDASQLPAIGDEETAREAADAALADGLAIIANGDTHAAVAEGQAVFVRSHSTLAPGLYWASSAIGTNAALSTSNLTPDSQGGLNKLKGDIDSLNSNFNTIVDLNCSYTTSYGWNSTSKIYAMRIGKIVIVTGFCNPTSDVPMNKEIASVDGINLKREAYVSAISSTGSLNRFKISVNGKVVNEAVMKANEWVSFTFVGFNV